MTIRIASTAFALVLAIAGHTRAADPLSSWNDTAPKQAVISFVEKVTKEGSSDFVPVPERIAVFDLADWLDVQPDNLMACMAWESAETFSPKVKNAAGSGAVGLIQFMPATARALGTTTTALAAMTVIEQLAYVKRYFQPYRGRLRTLSDLYMAILWPRGIGKAESYVLWSCMKSA